MSGSVTYCKKCGACNWAGKERCEVCGGELEPTLDQVFAQLVKEEAEEKK